MDCKIFNVHVMFFLCMRLHTGPRFIVSSGHVCACMRVYVCMYTCVCVTECFLFLMIYCCLSFLSSFFFTNTTHTNVHLHCRVDCKLIIIIYPLFMRVAGAPQMTSQPVSSIFPCSSLPSGTWQTPGLSIPWCCHSTSASICLVFFPFHCDLQDGFGQTWWMGDMTIPLQFAFLFDGQAVFQ